MRTRVGSSLGLAALCACRLVSAQSAAAFPDVDAPPPPDTNHALPTAAPLWAPASTTYTVAASAPPFVTRYWAPPSAGHTAPADDTVPPGYLREERPRTLTLALGGVALGLPWATGMGIAAAGGFPNGSGWLAAPVIGPWAALAKRSNPCDGLERARSFNSDVSQCVAEPLTRAMLVVDGVLQATGAALLIVGSDDDTVLVRQSAPAGPVVAAAPATLGRGAYGVRMIGRF